MLTAFPENLYPLTDSSKWFFQPAQSWFQIAEVKSLENKTRSAVA